MEQEIFTVDDIAKNLNIGKKLAYRLVKAKGCPVIKDSSKKIKVYKNDFYKWLDSYVGKKIDL